MAVAERAMLIDLHCHILPGLDDGPATIAESLALARRAVELGTGFELPLLLLAGGACLTAGMLLLLRPADG